MSVSQIRVDEKIIRVYISALDGKYIEMSEPYPNMPKEYVRIKHKGRISWDNELIYSDDPSNLLLFPVASR